MPVRRAAIAAPESRATAPSMPVPTKRRVGLEQRHGLALHVGAHQGAVGVVILEERDERGRDRNELLGRHVHIVDALGRYDDAVARMAADDEIVGQLALLVDRRHRLRDVVLRLLHRREIVHLVGDLAIHDAPIRALDEAVFVDARKSRERVDQADIRPFRRFDRADPAIMRRVHVAHLEARTLTRQAARAQARKASSYE